MHVSRLHWALNEPEIAPFNDIHESDGRGRAGPAEALATFHQLECDERQEEWLSLLARVEVDERNCIAMVVWRAVREAAAHLLSKHAASASWKHRWISSALGVVAAETDGPSAVQRLAAEGPRFPHWGLGGSQVRMIFAASCSIMRDFADHLLWRHSVPSFVGGAVLDSL